MCNRFSFDCSAAVIAQHFNIQIKQPLLNSYNIAPSQQAYVITNENPSRLQYLIWGLIPESSNEGRNDGKLINARKENISTTPSFRIPIRQRRCLVLADSFYTWKRNGLRTIPFRVTLKTGSPMVMAGVWDEWNNGKGIIKSFAIITGSSNNEMKDIYNRMPVIIESKEWQQKWLQDISLSDIQKIMDKKVEDSFNIYRISDKLQSIKYNKSDLHDEELDIPEEYIRGKYMKIN